VGRRGFSTPFATSAGADRRLGERVGFSVASIWEISIKSAPRRKDFHVDPAAPRARLLANDYREAPISSAHAIFAASLPRIHAGPFDRMLLAQAALEGLTLATADETVAKYPGTTHIGWTPNGPRRT
jgi:PIN domain nuclease of toxin-antitoxin system